MNHAIKLWVVVFGVALCGSLSAQGLIRVPGDYATIQEGVDAAVAGDTVMVADGVYYEVIDFLGKALDLKSENGPAATVVDGSGLNDAVVSLVGCGPGTRVEGFTLTHGDGKPFPSSFGYDYYGGGIHAGGGSQVVVENCRIVDNQLNTGTFAGGVYSGGEGTHVDLIGCVVAGNWAWASGGATLVDWSGSMRFENCTVTGNSSTNFFGHQGGIGMANYGTVEVHNSIVWGNSGTQIGSFSSPYDVGTHADATYSDIQGGFTGTGNLDADPQFVDAGVGSYHLSEGSPCIDAGDPLSAPDADGTAADMGAIAHLDTWATTYGSGCGGLTIGWEGVPRLGSTSPSVVLAGTGAASLAATLLIGASDDLWMSAALPLSLDLYGAPGCSLLVGPQILLPTRTDPSGTTHLSVTVPSLPELTGLQVYAQWAVEDVAANPLGYAFSDGLQVTVQP